jgi:hypothetical protein
VHGGQEAVLLVLVLLCGGALVRTARRARGKQGRSRTGGPVSGWLAHRRAVHLEQMRHAHAMLRDAARHRNRLEQEAARRERAEAGTGQDGTSGESGRRPRGGTVRSRVVRIGDDPAPPQPSRPSQPSQPSLSPRSPQEPPVREGSGPRPDPPAPGPPSPQPTRGSTVTVPFAEQVVDGINGIAAHARAGNILAKRRAMLALIAICQRASSMAMSLSRALAEPGQHYGPEVTEPIARGAMHLTAASLAFAEADTALTTLLRSSLAETMESGRQVPHHDEFAEGGAYYRGGTVGTAPPNTFVDPVRR